MPARVHSYKDCSDRALHTTTTAWNGLLQRAQGPESGERPEREDARGPMSDDFGPPPPTTLSAAESQLADHHDKLASRPRGLGLGAGRSNDDDASKDVAAMYNSLNDRHRTLDGGSGDPAPAQFAEFHQIHPLPAPPAQRNRNSGAAVLDLACGKGGDMLKFKASNIATYVGIDVAANSVRDAAVRYNGANGRQAMPFGATLLAGDYCDPTLPSRLPPNQLYHLASAQFSMHYAFRSEERARAFLSNASCRLHPGGVLVCTTPDANVLVKRLRAAPSNQFGNSLYTVKFGATTCGPNKTIPAATTSPYGLAYTFALKEAVEECEEYLVHIPTLRKLCHEFDLELLYATNFTEFFASEVYNHVPLLERMKALPENGYVSQEEWDVAHLYMVVAMRKRGGGGKGAPLEKNNGHKRVDPMSDIIYLNAEDEEKAKAMGGGAQAGASGREDAAKPEGETRELVAYDADDL